MSLFWLLPVKSQMFFLKKIFIDFRERGREERRKRERENLLFHLFMHSLIDSYTRPGLGWNRQPWYIKDDVLTNWKLLQMFLMASGLGNSFQKVLNLLYPDRSMATMAFWYTSKFLKLERLKVQISPNPISCKVDGVLAGIKTTLIVPWLGGSVGWSIVSYTKNLWVCGEKMQTTVTEQQ